MKNGLFDPALEFEIVVKIPNKITHQKLQKELTQIGCRATEEGWLESDDIAIELKVLEEVDNSDAPAPEKIIEGSQY